LITARCPGWIPSKLPIAIVALRAVSGRE